MADMDPFCVNLLLPPEIFEGPAELGVSRQGLLARKAVNLLGREWFGPLTELHLHVRSDAGLADEISLWREPLGDAEQDGGTIPQDEFREYGPGAEGGLPDRGRAAVVP